MPVDRQEGHAETTTAVKICVELHLKKNEVQSELSQMKLAKTISQNTMFSPVKKKKKTHDCKTEENL